MEGTIHDLTALRSISQITDVTRGLDLLKGIELPSISFRRPLLLDVAFHQFLVEALGKEVRFVLEIGLEELLPELDVSVKGCFH